MRLPPTVLAVCVALLAGAAVSFWRPAAETTAQEAANTLYVTGLRIDGTKAKAVVRLTNTSPNAGDVFGVHYTIQASNAGETLSLPGAGPSGAPLQAGRTLEIDVGAAVTSYRASFGLGPYRGTVRLVAYADPGAYLAFGPDTVHVAAVQSEARARYEPLVEWR